MAVTIPSPSKHLAHKVWVGTPEVVEFFLGCIINILALPADQQFNEGPIILGSGATVKNLGQLGAKDVVGVNRWQFGQRRGGRSQLGFKLGYMEDRVNTGVLR